MLTRRGFCGTAALALLAGPGTARAGADYWGRRLPDAPTEYLFGYGSLINTASRESTHGGRSIALPARLSPRFGLVRTWNARAGSGFTALGLRARAAGEDGASINGVVFPVDATTLPRFDRREAGYDRVAVPADMIEAPSWQRLPEGGTIWAYVPRKTAGRADAELPDALYPLVQSYVDLVVEGALEYGAEFARELIETTFDWSPYWLNDRETARRPWVATPNAGQIDQLLAKTPPASAAFPDRLLGEVYAARYAPILAAPRAR